VNADAGAGSQAVELGETDAAHPALDARELVLRRRSCFGQLGLGEAPLPANLDDGLTGLRMDGLN
jgi:hypothetical protein